MKKTFLMVAAMLTIVCAAQAQNYTLDQTIPLTGDSGYDYVSIDNVNHHLYVSHGTMVNVVDLNTNKEISVISGMKGVHGIAIANKSNRGFISDGRGTAVVAFDLSTFRIIATIPVTTNGPDGIIYDPATDRVFCFCGDANAASVVDPNTLKQIGTVDLGGGPEFAVADGNGLLYNNLEDKNSLNVIDAKALKVVKNYPLAPCGGPTGVAMDVASGRIFTACRQNKGMSVVDATNGKVIATLPIGAGVDAVCFDEATKLIFCSCGDGTTTIIKQQSADNYSVVQILKTPNRAKTMALDPQTHKIYLSVADFEQGTRKVLPGTFRVLVYKMD